MHSHKTPRAYAAVVLIAVTILSLSTIVYGQTVLTPQAYLPFIQKPLTHLSSWLGYVGTLENVTSYRIDGTNGFVYSTNAEKGYIVLDVRNMPNVGVKFISTPAYNTSVYVYGGYLYLGVGNTLQILDLSDPFSPRLVSSLDTGGYIGRIRIFGNYAYIASGGYEGFKIIDITDPLNPRLTGAINLQGTTGEVYVRNNIAYAASDWGLYVVDVANPTKPIQRAYVSAWGMNGIRVDGNYAYISGGLYGLYIVDIQNPAKPVIIQTTDTVKSASSIELIDGVGFISDVSEGIQIFDFRNPLSPKNIGSYPLYLIPNLGIQRSVDLKVMGNYIYVANLNNLHVFQYAIKETP